MAPTIGVNLRVTGHCNQGGRKYMEDMFSVAYQQTADELDLEYAYFGIFDGHGGQEAASFAKEHLMKAIVSQPGFWSNNDEDVLRAIKDGFIATHYAMWRNVDKWPKTASGLPSTSGTTASIAFIRKSNIYIGHVGDSCIVLGYQEGDSDRWKGAALTEDHKPESPCEHERIKQAGGQVVCKAGVPRVVWHRPRLVHQGPMTRSTHIDQIPFLAVARSLGDLWSYNADSDRFVVSPEPDVFVHRIELGRDKCLIFGTDGLWNMLAPDEAVTIVKKAEINNKSNTGDGQEQAWLNPSKCLVDCAISKWANSKLRADNTSAVTLLLDPLGPPNSQVLEQNVIASQPETKTEFVPYHIETYKVHEGKPSSQSNGLAICTWFPRMPVAAPLDKNNAGMTTLRTMEALFGENIANCNKDEDREDDEDDEEIEESSEEESSTTDVAAAAAGSVVDDADNENDDRTTPSILETPAAPLSYASVVKNNTSKDDLQITKDLSLIQIHNRQQQQLMLQQQQLEQQEETEEPIWVKKPRDSILSTPSLRSNNNDDNNPNLDKKPEFGMKLRNDITSTSKNYHAEPKNSKQTKKNIRRGKRRKNIDQDAEVCEYEQVEERKLDGRCKNKRRHSSLVESVNITYEPGVKRRSKSEDHRKQYYDSDTENENIKLKNEKMKIKSKRENVVGESSSEMCRNEFEPMKLRSNISVRTLRSRNINLEMLEFIDKLNTNNKKFNNNNNTNKNCGSKEEQRQQQPQQQESADSLVDKYTKLSNMLTRSSIIVKNSGKQLDTQRTVHTRSQNKCVKK